MSKITISRVLPSKFSEGDSYCKFVKSAGDSIGLTSTKNMGWAGVEGTPKEGTVILKDSECENYTRTMTLMTNDDGTVQRDAKTGKVRFTYKFHAVGMESTPLEETQELAEAMARDYEAGVSPAEQKEAEDLAKAKATAG